MAIAVYNQLEELNQLVGYFFECNDEAASSLPDYMKVRFAMCLYLVLVGYMGAMWWY